MLQKQTVSRWCLDGVRWGVQWDRWCLVGQMVSNGTDGVQWGRLCPVGRMEPNGTANGGVVRVPTEWLALVELDGIGGGGELAMLVLLGVRCRVSAD